MISGFNRTSFLALTVFFLLTHGAAQSSPEAALPAAAGAVKDIQLSYKRDPRLVDPFRGIKPWAAGPNFGGATAQDTVEVRAEGVNVPGKPVKINPEWIASDPEMVTVSPSQGDDVKVTVHKAGESKLRITYQGVSKELEIKARYVNKFMLFEIEEARSTKLAVPSVAEAPQVHKSKNDVSYAAGMNLAKALQEQSQDVDVDSLVRGIRDTLSGGKTLMTEEQALAALEGLQTDQRIVEDGLNRKALGEKNKREGEAFLAENKKKDGVVTLPSGLEYKVITMGDGKKPTANDVVTVKYRATFIDGKEFENSGKHNTGAISLPVQSTIRAWQEALPLMPVGSKWELFVPADLAYGERGSGGGRSGRRPGPVRPVIGPNATLIFDVDLLAAEPPTTEARAGTLKASSENGTVSPEVIEAIKQLVQEAKEKEAKSGTEVENQ
jgi:FKBP-type peptidyl-prolyl cis-trans isomerase FklB